MSTPPAGVDRPGRIRRRPTAGHCRMGARGTAVPGTSASAAAGPTHRTDDSWGDLARDQAGTAVGQAARRLSSAAAGQSVRCRPAAAAAAVVGAAVGPSDSDSMRRRRWCW